MSLQEYLEKNKISYRDLAKKAGVNYTTIFKYLKQDSRALRYDIAVKVSKATGGKVSVDSLAQR